MTCIRDIIDPAQLEREFRAIRTVFEGLGENEKPLRIEWGTKQAFESAAAVGPKKFVVAFQYYENMPRYDRVEVDGEWTKFFDDKVEVLALLSRPGETFHFPSRIGIEIVEAENTMEAQRRLAQKWPCHIVMLTALELAK
jgi:hypothetical protein